MTAGAAPAAAAAGAARGPLLMFGMLPDKMYSTARAESPYAALSARTASARSNAMSTKFCTAAENSSSESVVLLVGPLAARAGAVGDAGVAAGSPTGREGAVGVAVAVGCAGVAGVVVAAAGVVAAAAVGLALCVAIPLGRKKSVIGSKFVEWKTTKTAFAKKVLQVRSNVRCRVLL